MARSETPCSRTSTFAEGRAVIDKTRNTEAKAVRKSRDDQALRYVVWRSPCRSRGRQRES